MWRGCAALIYEAGTFYSFDCQCWDYGISFVLISTKTINYIPMKFQMTALCATLLFDSFNAAMAKGKKSKSGADGHGTISKAEYVGDANA